jgi:hypothetical protein
VKPSLNRLIRAASILVVGVLAGCLPIPHTTPRSNEFSGRVLDAETHLPIAGVSVSLNQSPHHTIYTDSNGYFRMKAQENFHWLYVAPEGHWPNPKDPEMKISHPNYITLWGGFGGDVGNILLKPIHQNSK